MELNTSLIDSNVTLSQVAKYFNISISNLTNQSVEAQVKWVDLYELYKNTEREQLRAYQFVAYVVGTLIVLSNITVVISSGLILKKGQQPKSTYLLLGNVSLADTIIGFSVIFGVLVDHSDNTNSNPLCIFQIGMLVCPAMVSIFSVGLIAIDRYIYILHGLYYQRWFNTTKVRIGIVCIWLIGLLMSFLPATGWINKELQSLSCSYVTLYPGALILLISLLSVLPIIITVILYVIILLKALKNIKTIKSTEKSVNNSEINNSSKLRINIGSSLNQVAIDPSKVNKNRLCRSSSFEYNCNRSEVGRKLHRAISKSSGDINKDYNVSLEKPTLKIKEASNQSDSQFSIMTTQTTCSETDICKGIKNAPKSIAKTFCKKIEKPKGPNKWRAITVVMLTTGCFIITWVPFFVTVSFFVFCKEKRTNRECINYKILVSGPMATLAFLNSILNPLIYAWWHKGFQRSIKSYYQKFSIRFLRKNVNLNSSS